MGLLSRLFGKQDDDDAPVVQRPLDQDARRAQLHDLEIALEELIAAMEQPPSPVTNPGWQGRLKDYKWSQGGATMLQKQTITREELVDITAGVRPVFGPTGPTAGLEHLAPLSDRVQTLIRALEDPLPSEQ